MADTEGVALTEKTGPTRDLTAARAAYKAGDAAASKAAHGGGHGHSHDGGSPEMHSGTPSEYIKSMVRSLRSADAARLSAPPRLLLPARRPPAAAADAPLAYSPQVFGGLDGIITTFAVVAAVAGADLPQKTVLMMGIANLVSDGISMGLGDFLSEKSERSYIEEEWKRETWELENDPDGEKTEMIELYVEEGMTLQDATAIVEAFSNYPKMFVNLMMVDELDLEKFDADEEDEIWKQGAITCVSFWVFGSVPVIGFQVIAATGLAESTQNIFLLDCIVTMLTMFALGWIKAGITSQNKLKEGVLMVLNGGLACSAGYLVAWATEVAVTD